MTSNQITSQDNTLPLSNSLREKQGGYLVSKLNISLVKFSRDQASQKYFSYQVSKYGQITLFAYDYLCMRLIL